MITFKQEILFDMMEEMKDLLQLHYAELTLHKERIKLDPMWERYADLERLGNFVLFSAREDGKLVGYSAFFINQHMHYAGTTIAINDVLFLHPDYRRGPAGIRLIKFSEQMLGKMAVDKITWHVKLNNDWRPILHRYGYRDEETVVGKILGR